MVGLDIAAGYLFSWLVRKARRAAGQADKAVDQILDAELDRLHELVDRKLGMDPALERVKQEVQSGQKELSEVGQQWLTLALQARAEEDPGFGAALWQVLERLAAVSGEPGPPAPSAAGGVAVGGNVAVHAEDGSVAAVKIEGGLTVNPRMPGPAQG